MPFDIDIPCHPVFLIPGEARLLTRRLERQFGPLPEAIRKRISEASLEELDNWADRLHEAASLEAIFTA